MRFPRSSGLLLHPTSLPGGHGIGDLGPTAYEFLDFLGSAGQTLWQVLPLGPTGYEDSPYQTFSAFAGNPILLSLERLAEQGLVEAREVRDLPRTPGRVVYAEVLERKMPLLRKAAQAFARDASPARKSALERFRAQAAFWLDDYALFMAIKEAHGLQSWTAWPGKLRDRQPEALAEARKQYAEAVRHAHRAAIPVLRAVVRPAAGMRRARRANDGRHPDLCGGRQLRRVGQPQVLADSRGRQPGLHGRAFRPTTSRATGQLWGNPIYRWDAHEQDGYSWWIERFRATLQMVDMVRVDHFRGFQAYWQVPWGETTAMHGEWVPGPGAKIFEAVEKALGELPILAENLGVITPEVEAIRNRFGLPGMAILQFAFGTDPQAPSFKPHNYPREVVAYSGTHDNDTTVGWWTSAGRRLDEDRGGHRRRARLHARVPRRGRARDPLVVHPRADGFGGRYGDLPRAGCAGARLGGAHEHAVHGRKELEVADDAGSFDRGGRRKAAQDGGSLRPGRQARLRERKNMAAGPHWH